MKRTVKGDAYSSFGVGYMGDSYRDAIRKQGKKGKDTSVSRAIARSAAKSRAKIRAQHSRVARSADRSGGTQIPFPAEVMDA